LAERRSQHVGNAQIMATEGTGWYQIEAGNFQASQLFSGSGDQCRLSFKIDQLDILTR